MLGPNTSCYLIYFERKIKTNRKCPKNNFKTSKLCNCCNEKNRKVFLEKPSKKPKRKGEIDLCHVL